MTTAIRSSRSALVAVVVAATWLAVAAQSARPAPKRTEIAPGIHLFETSSYGDVGLDGNSIAVLSTDGVLVFDSNGTPAASAAVLAEIRKLTDKPVRYVVNSHWHWDHWYGTETYQHAFPDVRVVTHEKTRAMMAGPAIAFNRPGVESQLPAYRERPGRRARADPRPTPLSDVNGFFLEKKKHAPLVLPNVTSPARFVVDRGELHGEILNYGRGVTPGDTSAYLPKEQI